MSEINPSPDFEEKIRQAVRVPDAKPEFVDKLRSELVRSPVRTKPRFVLKPAWAFALALLLIALIGSAPAVVNALKILIGYVQGVGLVENTGNLRMLTEPVAVTRDGVTLTITSVFVYEDRVELTYEVDGIIENYSNQSDMCGAVHPGNDFWSDADADLRLPDGTVIRRDYAGKYQFENRYAMKPIYAVHMPANVDELTMLLKCLPFTRLGETPENWEVPFKLTSIPEGTIVGAPVIDVAPTAVQPLAEPLPNAPKVPAPVVTMTFERIVSLDSMTVIYLSMDMENQDPSLISIMPVTAYITDSHGQKIPLIGNFVWQPFEHRTGTQFEFTSASKPADGPLTVIVENAVAYYAPLYVEPPQATPEQMSFTFDAGASPQHNQTWELNKEFTIAGFPLKITSARAVTFEDIRTPDFIDGSQGYDYGYQFAVESDPSVKLNIWMDVIAGSSMCGLSNNASFVPSDSKILFTQLCRDSYPSGSVRVTIGELSVLVENTWQATWTP